MTDKLKACKPLDEKTTMFEDFIALNEKMFLDTVKDFEKFPFLFSADEQIALSAFFSFASDIE